jgi:opacity protein-like surface antigen
MKKVALLSVLSVLVAIPALAVPPDYMTLKLGGYFPQRSDLKDDFSTGFIGEWAIGHSFHPNMAMDFSIGYFETKANNKEAIAKLSVVPVFLNIKGVIPMARGEIYALAAGGLYVVTGEGSVSGVTFEDSDTPFGWQVGIGGNYNLSETVFLGLEGKYFKMKPAFYIPGVRDLLFYIDGIQATANIGYRW